MALQQRLVECWADSLASLSYRQPQTEYRILTAFNVLYVLACELGDSCSRKATHVFKICVYNKSNVFGFRWLALKMRSRYRVEPGALI